MDFTITNSQHVSKNCLVCGVENKFGLKTRFYETAENELVAVFTGKGPHGRDYRRATSLEFEKGLGARFLELAITELLASRATDATICPSEAARRVAPDDWRPLMEPARAAARRLVAAGRIDIYVERDIKPWDYAAGSLIAEEAGARVSDRHGHTLCFNSPERQTAGVLAGGPEIVAGLLSRLA